MDFDQVLPTVYIGSYPRTTRDIDRLAWELGVTAVLNLQTDEDYAVLGCDWESLAAHYATKDIVVRRVPVIDFDGEDLCRHLPDAVQALEELLHAKHVVYVHCTQGMGRAPSVVVAHLHWIVRLSLDDAAQHVLHYRMCVPHVDAIQEASLKLPAAE